LFYDDKSQSNSRPNIQLDNHQKTLTGSALIVCAGFFSIFYFFPLGKILWYGLSPENIATVFGSPTTWKIIWFTLWQAIVSTTVSLCVGVLIANILTRFNFRGRGALSVLATIPFVMPTVVVASAFLSLNSIFRLEGTVLNLEGTAFGVIVAHVFFNTAIVVRTLGGWWGQLSSDPEYAARTLGAGTFKTFFLVTLPRLKPALIAAGSLTFLFTFTSFGIILILGSLKEATIETEVWRYATQRIDIDTAAALGIAQLAIVVLMLIINSRLRSKYGTSELGSIAVSAGGTHNTKFRRTRLYSGVIFTVLFLGTPLALLIERSLRTPKGYSFTYYQGIFTESKTGRFSIFETRSAIINSITWALLAMAIATILGYLAAVLLSSPSTKIHKPADVLLLLPLGTSGVLLGFGIIVTLNSSFWDIRSSWWIIPTAQAILGIGLVARIVGTALREVNPEMRDAAKVLGASNTKIWRHVDLPIISKSLVAGASFSFAIAIGEFGATAFLVRPQRPTIPTTIFNLLGRPGASTYGQAMALCVVLAGITALSISLLDRSGTVIRDTA
tara:strand:- start:4215 stop:5888 length:1674 start_codon:yes stop_codon:yes gene_type:complete